MSAAVMNEEPAPVASGDPAAAPAASVSPADWEQAAARVERYLRALGVRDPADLDQLSGRIRTRFERLVETRLVADAIETGIEEASNLLDDWLASELGPDVSDAQRRVARAVVLSGAIRGWVAAWCGRIPAPPDRPIGEQIRARSLVPVPEPAPLAMVTQRIDPCCYRLIRRLARWLGPIRSDSPSSRRVELGGSR